MSKAIKVGLIAGVLVSLFSIAHQFITIEDETLLLIFRFIPISITVLSIFLSIKATRDALPGGLIDFKSALKAGIITTTINTLVYGVTTFVIFKTTDPATFKAEFQAVLAKEISAIGKESDSAKINTRFNHCIASADSSLGKQDYDGATRNYIEALALKPGDKHASEKLNYLVDLRIAEFTNTGYVLQNLLSVTVFHIIIGGVIAAISYFFLRKGEKVF